MLKRVLGHLVLLLFAASNANAFNQSLPDPQTAVQVTALYRANQGQNLWVRFGRPTPLARAALSVLSEAHSHGLDPEDYRVDLLHVLHESLYQGAREHAEFFERELTASLLRLIADMRPAAFGALDDEARSEALALVLLDAVYADNLEGLLDRLAPKNPQYAALKGALREYDRRAHSGRQVSIGRGPPLEPGDVGERVARLRMRLLGIDDRAYGEYERSIFDATLEEAVKAYQALHGLDADGIVGATTVEHLDTSTVLRRAQIKLNLERWRRLPVELGREHVLVNIPEFRLRLVQSREEQLSMRVVVGAKSDPTPELNDEIEYLVFNPYWYVPRSIVGKELIPAQTKNLNYLSKNGYELLTEGKVVDASAVDWTADTLARFPYRVRQKPGPGNALGGVKFVFPNVLDIYLHDSPAKSLYSRAQRAFSHGCIRLENPEALAEALLREHPEWTESRISSTIARGETRQVNLADPVPVYLVYMTVRVQDDGRIGFFEDIYGRDRPKLATYL